MHIRSVIAAAFAIVLAATNTNATTLTGDIEADNIFFAYLSTTPSSLGTYLAGGSIYWPVDYNFTSNTLPKQTLYLNIEVQNGGGPGGLIGQFTLSDSYFHFANGNRTLLTNTTNWTGNYNTGNYFGYPIPWITATGAVVSTALSYTPYISQGFTYWVPPFVISHSAGIIWPSDSLYAPDTACPICTVDFTTPIYYSGTSTTPIPSALSLFATGLGVLGMFIGRRKRKAAA